MKLVQELYITFEMKVVSEIFRIQSRIYSLINLGKLFSYVFGDASCQARMETSDPKPMRYSTSPKALLRIFLLA